MSGKVVAHVPEYKKKIVKELKDLSEGKKTVLIASIKNIPCSQFQAISKKLRGKAVVKVPKKNLIERSLDSQKNEELKKLKGELTDSFALLFSDLDTYELAGELIKNKTPAKAKPWQEAPMDIEVPEGPTDLVPGPAISELGALGIQIQIEKGKIHIKQAKIIVKKGDKIKPNAAALMGKLDIKPFSIGFTPVCAFDTEKNVLYTNIKIDRDEAVNELLESYNRALPFAVEIGYMSKDTIGFMLAKAAAHANKINRIFTGEPEAEVVAEVVETPIEEKKEEPKADAAAGLASLFG